MDSHKTNDLKRHERTVCVIPSSSDVEKALEAQIAQGKPMTAKRVAAYARVSTSQEEQEGSFAMQVSYYSDYIRSNPQWEFAGIYTDEGVSGTSCKHRNGFNRMLDDAKAGKIDLILTKSISRFARNTVDSLAVTRELRDYGVEVLFEKENINSMDMEAEFILTIMSSIAQEESRTISENVKWGMQRSMEAGKVSIAYKNFLGYRKGEDGNPEIVEAEAKIVRKIYQLFLTGNNYHTIARKLTKDGILTPSGHITWHAETVRSILTNEKYKGDALLQKTYVEDFLTHKVKINHGERKQYYVRNSHLAMISPEIFDMVQEEIKKRNAERKTKKVI